MTTRTMYFKAADVTLEAPYYAGRGSPYLPGTEHRPDLLDPDASKSCTHGLYYCSHRRVAARWGPVVLQVQVLGQQIKTNDKVRPGKQPDAVEAQKYNKYRTDLMRILGVIGVTGYAGHLGWTGRRDLGMTTEGSQANALDNVRQLNQALRQHGLEPVFFTGQSLERLRHDSFQLWGVNDPNMQAPVSTHRAPWVKHTIEIEFKADKQLTEADIYSHLGLMQGVLPGSQRIVQMR